ncbi:MAG TPA: ATP-binding protein [Thermoanaerobaculia bacterium]|nr:ATP-binding protein [Thermoanaerobaculia bacterium]
MPNTGLAAVTRLTGALGRASSLPEVYGCALDALQASLGVERASVLLFDDEGVMSFVAWRGLSDEYRRAVNGHSPWRPDTRDAVPICVPDTDADPSLAGYRPVFEREQIRALGFFPLIYGERVIGKFMLYYREPHAFDDAEVQLAATIAGQIAFGVARIRAEAELARERDRLGFLAKASETLSASIDYETTLEQIARLVVTELADWCVVDVLEEGGIGRVAASHRDPARQAAVRKIRGVDVSRQRSGTIRRVIESGQPALVRHIDWDSFAAMYADEPEIIETFAALGFASYMSVPLPVRGQCLGAITLVSSERAFDTADLELATELGRRAAYAIDNARLYREAQDANRAKDEFLATLSHELRTPMTATLGWAAMLRRHALSPETVQLAIDTIDRSTRAQAQLIDDILDVSRIVSGKMQLNVAPLNVRGVVDAAIDAIRPTVAAKHLDLHLELSDIPAIAVADGSRLQQVLWNLLSNAVKFTPPGGAVTVTLHDPEDERVRITVRDTGIGIPRRFLPHVFERFRQADSSSSRVHDGLGLGLSIVKSITEMHGGTIEVESEGEGRGATFTLTLPTASPAPVAALAPAEAASPLVLSGVSVLLVEDEDDTRTMLSAALQSFGAHVTAVRSAAAAVESLHAAAPHVIVSDIGMPGEDGYRLMLRIRASENERVRGVPAIALTAYVATEDRTRVLASGYDYHLSKPVDPLLVVETVREAAGR